MKIEELHNIFLKTGKIITDSRLKTEGGLFFALKGDNFDANDYTEQAIKNGCTYAVTSRKSLVKQRNHIYFDDTLLALQELASFHRKHLGIPILAITGTNGKTTTKELISAVLSRKFNLGFTKGNFNNHIGVPLTLLSFTNENNFGVVEMGANHKGEIAELCSIVDPDFGIITNVGKAHLEGFGSFENIIETKCELYDYIKNKKGKILLNGDNSILKERSIGIDTFTYGTQKTEVTGKIHTLNPHIDVNVSYGADTFNISTQLLGKYNLDNILAAVSAGILFNINTKEIKKAIEEYTPQNNRSQYLQTKNNEIYLDAYNANPSSMKVAIESFAELPSKNKIVILGEMKELGHVSSEEHNNLKKIVEDLSFEKTIYVGNWNSDSKGINEFADTDSLKQWLKTNKIEKKTILIKGSRGNKLESILELL